MDNFFSNTTYASYINGAFVNVTNPQEMVSPVDGKPWGKVQLATPTDVETALGAVQTAPLLPKEARIECLLAFAKFLEKYQREIATTISCEMGKVIRSALQEVDYAKSYFLHFAEEVKKIGTRDIQSPDAQKKLMTIDAPVGPCFVMTPWNFPLAMGARKMAPAIATGCPLIGRPSSTTPVSLLILAAIAHELQLPAGLLNVLIGSTDTIVDPLMASPTIKKISFTGSTSVGKELYTQCGPTLKHASMELGGNAPFIVFEDADLEKAVKGAMAAKFRNNGQSCIAANRFLIHKSLYEPFIEAFKSNVKRLYIGNPFDEKAEVSLVLHESSREKILKDTQDAIDQGARVILREDNPAKPQIFADITPAMNLFKEEIFGPVASIMSFETFDDALALANQTEFGLAAYVFSESEENIQKAAGQLEFGIIGVNDGTPSCAQLPFGGIKDSGFGKEGGPDAIYEYLIKKAVSRC